MDDHSLELETRNLLRDFGRSERETDFLARKDELQSVRAELKEDISNLKVELKGDIADLRTELKEDIFLLKNNITENHSEMKRFIENSVAQTEINTLKQFVKFWTTGAAIAVPVLTGIIVALLNFILPK